MVSNTAFRLLMQGEDLYLIFRITLLYKIIIVMMITKIPFLRPFLPSTSFLSYSFASENTPRRFRNRQKARPAVLSKSDQQLHFNPVQALHLMRLHSFTTFQQSVEICIRLNVNPKNGQQIVRGTANLPAGLGKKIITAVLCSKDEWEELQEKGVNVDIHLKDDDIKQLQRGSIQFDKLFTTPTHIQKLKPLGKQLGPKGLMPNAKIGTLVPYHDLPLALEQAKSGQVSFRVDDGRNIHAHIGKASFTDQQLLVNWKAVMETLVNKRPPTLKGKYFTHAYLKSTMGPGWRIQLLDIDPRTDKSIWGCLEDDKVQEVDQTAK